MTSLLQTNLRLFTDDAAEFSTDFETTRSSDESLTLGMLHDVTANKIV